MKLLLICKTCHETVPVYLNVNLTLKPDQTCNCCGNKEFTIPKEHICDHCHGDIRIHNPSGFCNHIYYPENCEICKERMKCQS